MPSHPKFSVVKIHLNRETKAVTANKNEEGRGLYRQL